MNHDPRKAIRQAMMIARRHAADGGFYESLGRNLIAPYTYQPSDFPAPTPLPRPAMPAPAAPAAPAAPIAAPIAAPAMGGEPTDTGGGGNSGPNAAGPSGAPGTGNFGSDLASFTEATAPGIAGAIAGGMMAGPPGAMAGAMAGMTAANAMGMNAAAPSPADTEDADQGAAQSAAAAAAAAEAADNANSMSEASTSDAAGAGEGGEGGGEGGSDGGGAGGGGGDGEARGGRIGKRNGGRMDPRSLPGIHVRTDHRFAAGGATPDDEEEGFDAYHGSPHEFERFDSSKIGTGEGAQAFGYGHYLAENEGVARQYRNKLAPTTLVTQSGSKHAYSSSAADEIAGDLLKGASPQIRYPVEHALGLMMRGSALDSAISKMRNDYDHFDPKNLDEAVRLLRQHNPDPISSGHMYHVRVKAKPEHFLDWDAPLSEQPHVLNAIDQHIGDPEIVLQQLSLSNKSTGRDLHEAFGGERKPKDVANKLQSMNIPGIKYFDRDSRSTGEGTRNYVIFDPDIIKIKRRYADGGAALKPYVASYLLGREGQYNPEFYETVPNPLLDENGNVLAQKDRLQPRENTVSNFPIEETPETRRGIGDTIYRGMSHEEYENFKKTGRIQSAGQYNIGADQKGLTYFTTSPRAAESYSNSFAPEKHKPTFDRPAYIVAVKRPADEHIKRVRGTGEHEIGVTRPIDAEEVKAVYRGRVVAYDPGEKNSVSPTAYLHWEKIAHRADGGMVGGDPFLSSPVPIEGVNGGTYVSQGDLDNRIQQAALGQGYADGGQIIPQRDLDADPVVQRALRLAARNRPLVALADLFQRQLRGRPPS